MKGAGLFQLLLCSVAVISGVGAFQAKSDSTNATLTALEVECKNFRDTAVQKLEQIRYYDCRFCARFLEQLESPIRNVTADVCVVQFCYDTLKIEMKKLVRLSCLTRRDFEITSSACPIPPGPGCCVTMGYEAMMKPCCHTFTDNVDSKDCQPSSERGRYHYPSKSCDAIMEIYKDELSPSQTPSVSISPSRSDSSSLSASISTTNSPSASPSPLLQCAHLNNCSGHGDCVNNICKCHKGFGKKNTQLPDDCSDYVLGMCPDLCNGHGDCVNGTSGMVCKCNEGFSGSTCNVWVACEYNHYCSGHGSCQAPNTCICQAGFGGYDCSTTESELLSCGYLQGCLGRGICVTGDRGVKVCNCSEGYEGQNCNRISRSALCPAGCSGNGICRNKTCVCNDGFSGPDCSTVVNACEISCGHGRCNQSKCECIGPFKGPHCNQYDGQADLQCSQLSFCNGRGVCTSSSTNPAKKICVCYEGFSGDQCNIIDANDLRLCPDYCSGHGRCERVGQTVECVCESGWTGANCAVSLCDIDPGNHLVCGGRGVCEENGTCACDEGWTSDYSHVCTMSLCPSECNQKGRCLSSGVCICQRGYTGPSCTSTSSSFTVQSMSAGHSEPEPIITGPGQASIKSTVVAGGAETSGSTGTNRSPPDVTGSTRVTDSAATSTGGSTGSVSTGSTSTGSTSTGSTSTGSTSTGSTSTGSTSTGSTSTGSTSTGSTSTDSTSTDSDLGSKAIGSTPVAGSTSTDSTITSPITTASTTTGSTSSDSTAIDSDQGSAARTPTSTGSTAAPTSAGATASSSATSGQPLDSATSKVNQGLPADSSAPTSSGPVAGSSNPSTQPSSKVIAIYGEIASEVEFASEDNEQSFPLPRPVVTRESISSAIPLASSQGSVSPRNTGSFTVDVINATPAGSTQAKGGDQTKPKAGQGPGTSTDTGTGAITEDKSNQTQTSGAGETEGERGCNKELCNGHGTCDVELKCNCFDGYSGTSCQKAEPLVESIGPSRYQS